MNVDTQALIIDAQTNTHTGGRQLIVLSQPQCRSSDNESKNVEDNVKEEGQSAVSKYRRYLSRLSFERFSRPINSGSLKHKEKSIIRNLW